MTRRTALLLLLCLLLTGCGTPPATSLATQTAMVQVAYLTPAHGILTAMAAPLPTYTDIPPSPTATDTPTNTPLPTDTPVPTATPIPTRTPRIRPTLLPTLPPLLPTVPLTATVVAQPTGVIATPQPGGKVEYGERFADWDYTATLVEGGFSIAVNWLASDISSGTEADLTVYANRNRELLAQVQGQATIRLIFARPLTLNDYNAFVRQYKLPVAACFLRYLRPDPGNGEDRRLDVTLCQNNAPLTAAAVTGAIAGTPAASQPVLRGAIEVAVVTDAATARKLFDDPRIYAVDATYATAEQRTRAFLRAARPDLAEQPVIQRGPILFWALEDVGLIK